MPDSDSHLLPELDPADAGALSAEQLVEMMQEFTASYDRLAGLPAAVSFFGSARTGRETGEYRVAMASARLLSRAGFAVISGGGPGIMEAVNRGGQQGGAPSVGLNIRLPGRREPPNPYQDISLTFQHFFVRKSIFVHFASAFVVLPGGFGTLDEVLECLTLMQTDKAHRIPVILVDSEFWAGLTGWFRQTLLQRGMISDADLSLFRVLDRPEEIRDAIVDFHAGRDRR